jgi:uncharacterized Zn finger protein (UPF0148 family)
MTIPFEVPEKGVLRERVRIAIDAAGFQLIDEPEAFPLPAELGLSGGVVGDLQGLTPEGVRHAFYLRLDGTKALPPWIANVARSAHALEALRVYVVVTESSEALEASCRACGAGLLRIEDDEGLTPVVAPEEYQQEALRTQVAARVRALRRRLTTRLELNLGSLREDFARVEELTAHMTEAERAEWRRAIETSSERWSAWGEHASNALAAAADAEDDAALDAVEAMIDAGPA